MIISNFKSGEKEVYERKFHMFFRDIQENNAVSPLRLRLTRAQKRLEWKLVLREKTHTRANDNPKK